MVATPIGNLGDITFRAVKVLEASGLIAAEDTRRTRKLLSSRGIGARVVSCNEHNEMERLVLVLELLSAGRDVALVSDAGTPGISDPGQRLIGAVRENGFDVVPIPGPSAVACALSVCGMSARAYHFAGFLPASATERRKALEGLSELDTLLVFFESPHRITDAIMDMIEVLGDRMAFLSREMTKLHETYLSGPLSGILGQIDSPKRVRGEITMVVEGAKRSRSRNDQISGEMTTILRGLLTEGTMGVREAATLLSKVSGVKRGKVYEAALNIVRKGREQ